MFLQELNNHENIIRCASALRCPTPARQPRLSREPYMGYKGIGFNLNKARSQLSPPLAEALAEALASVA